MIYYWDCNYDGICYLPQWKAFNSIQSCNVWLAQKQTLKGFQTFVPSNCTNLQMLICKQYIFWLNMIDISQIRIWTYYDLLSKIIWQDVSQWHEKLLIISDVVLAHKSNVTLFVTFLNALCCYFHTLLFSTTVNLQFSRGKYSYYISGYVLCNIIIVRKSLS